MKNGALYKFNKTLLRNSFIGDASKEKIILKKESIDTNGPYVLVDGDYQRSTLYHVMEWYKNGTIKRKNSQLLQVYPPYYDVDASASKFNLPSNNSDGSSYHGKYSSAYTNGQIKEQGNYFKNKKVGEWVYFSENGALEKKKNYPEIASIFLDDRVYKIRAKSGLNVRNKPSASGQKVGVIAFENPVLVLAKTGIELTINDTDRDSGETKKVSGEWVKIKTLEGNVKPVSGYVFDVFF